MAILLSIDTATEDASVCISQDNRLLAIERSNDQKNHASFIHVAIEKILNNCAIQFATIDAIAVTEGPGSYTGLRVGMATAKGLCYAAQKPLITVNTLDVMAKAAIDYVSTETAHALHTQADYIVQPMIDARRMEVFTASYNRDLNILNHPEAIIIDEFVLEDWRNLKQSIVFIGSGIKKITAFVQDLPHVFLVSAVQDASHLAKLAQQKLKKKSFADLAYCEPFYLKQFFSTAKKG